MKYDWSSLTKLQVGKYAEYYVKMFLTQYGLDVYSAEVDDKGIDFVIRVRQDKYVDIQVKSVRKGGYAYMTKDKFQPRDNLYLALVVFPEGAKPLFALIPSNEWLTDRPSFLADRDFVGLQSSPEYGISISKNSLPQIIEKYAIEVVLPHIINE